MDKPDFLFYTKNFVIKIWQIQHNILCAAFMALYDTGNLFMLYTVCLSLYSLGAQLYRFLNSLKKYDWLLKPVR